MMKRKNMIKKVITSVLVLLMVAMTACQSKAPETTKDAESDASTASDSGEVVINLMMSNSQEPGVSKAVEAFNEAYAGKIKCVADYVAFDDVFETLEVLMSNKSTEYDLFAVDGPNVSAYVNRGYLQPLNQWMSSEEIGEFTAPMVVEGTYEEQFYGAPMGNTSAVLYYNKALLEEAGIDIDFDAVTPDNRLTWEALVNYSKEALDTLDPNRTNGIYGIEFQQVGRVYQMNILANAFGGENISADGMSVDGVIDSEPWTKALNFYQQQVSDGIFTRGIDATETSSYFQSGKILFYIGTTQLPTTFEDNGFTNYGYTYIPAFEGYEDVVKTFCGSWTIGMNIYSEKQDAAAEFIKYLTVYDGADVYINASGMVPALTRQFTDELLAAKPYMAIAKYEGLNTALVRAVTPAYSEYATAVNALWDDVRNGADIKDSVQRCAEELSTAFKRYE